LAENWERDQYLISDSGIGDFINDQHTLPKLLLHLITTVKFEQKRSMAAKTEKTGSFPSLTP
jgi:hypothetical protein